MVAALAPGSAPSPQSEAVANELQELSLQSGCSPLPLQERKNVLQLKLQQRRTREELVSQGIMPPLKSPAAFHEQRRSLERAQTEDYLKRKIRSRPERSELVRMHILEETSAEPSLQAKQLKLKRARLADNLNDKISHRPGPIELIQKNILPVHCSLDSTLAEEEFPKGAGESSSVDEYSSDALSPDQPANHCSPLGPASLPSPSDTLAHSSSNPSPTQAPYSQFLSQAAPVPALSASPPHRLTNGTPVLVGSRSTSGMIKSHCKSGSDRPSLRSKKAKESKPKVKKLKYHQYIPPDQKAEREPPPQLDDSYAKILHQQQLFLQLQIINQQQQQHYNYHTILPAPPKLADQQPSSKTGPSPSRNVPASSPASANQNGLSRQCQTTVGGAKPGSLPPNLDEFKVAELKQELKLRSLHVSGTKNDLIERLRHYQEQNGGAAGAGGGTPKNSPSQRQQCAQHTGSSPAHGDTPVFHQSRERGAMLANLPAMATAGTPHPIMHFGSTSSSPPLSPTPSDRSYAGMSMDETSCSGDVFGETVSSPLTQLSLHPTPLKEESASPAPACRLSQHAPLCAAGSLDKDQMLQEKDRRIEELTRMLLQKQRLVETLRSQLGQGGVGVGARAVKDEPPDAVLAPGAPGPDAGGTALRDEAEVGRSEPELQAQQDVQLQQLQKEALRALQQPQSQQVPQVFLSSQSGTPGSAPSFSLDLLKTHPAPTLLTDSNGNHYLIAVTSRSAESQRNGCTQGKATSRITLQRLHSSPSKIPVQSASQPASTDTQSKQPLQPDLIAKPIVKGQKAGLHMLTSSSRAGSSLSAPPNDVGSSLSAPPNDVGSSLSAPPNDVGSSLCAPPNDLGSSLCAPPNDVGSSLCALPNDLGSSLSAPPNVQAFFLSNQSSSGGHAPSSPTHTLIGEGCSGLDQHTLFRPASTAPKQTLSSPQHGKVNGSCSQHMDDLFDILIQSGEISSGLKGDPDPSLSRLHLNTPPSSPDPSMLHLSPLTPPESAVSQRPAEKTSAPHTPPGGGGGTCAGSGRLEDFLESTTGTPLIGVEPDGPLTLIDDLHSQMLSTSSILDHPPTPMDTCELSFAPQPQGLDFGDGALDSMDWLDVTMGVSGTGGVGLAPLGSHMPPSVFSADFLDSSDLQLHWESCL
ncbi:hypothetical protein AAFF_G00295950 [Aldrovandia affinis]|uniref:SAP domain-containing protein n=1 Tax=Aldrovandia affinis TaxID=143900 RepID=A0AAD7WSF9_9TELE|nr:hypothetical protein AAFF_G00295950 [Aldrovandia affinis]